MPHPRYSSLIRSRPADRTQSYTSTPTLGCRHVPTVPGERQLPPSNRGDDAGSEVPCGDQAAEEMGPSTPVASARMAVSWPRSLTVRLSSTVDTSASDRNTVPTSTRPAGHVATAVSRPPLRSAPAGRRRKRWSRSQPRRSTSVTAPPPPQTPQWAGGRARTSAPRPSSRPPPGQPQKWGAPTAAGCRAERSKRQSTARG